MHTRECNTNDVFDMQITAEKLLHLFEGIARTLTSEHLHYFDQLILEKNYQPAFPEILKLLEKLNYELHIHANLITTDYKNVKGYKSARLTIGCKRIIKKATYTIIEKAISFPKFK